MPGTTSESMRVPSASSARTLKEVPANALELATRIRAVDNAIAIPFIVFLRVALGTPQCAAWKGPSARAMPATKRRALRVLLVVFGFGRAERGDPEPTLGDRGATARV